MFKSMFAAKSGGSVGFNAALHEEPAPKVAPLNPIAAEIAHRWHERAKAGGLKPFSAAYRRAEVEYAAGAMAALCACFPNADNPEDISKMVPVYWVLAGMSGRPIFGDHEAPKLPGIRILREVS
jgi:hypothetical protein